MRKFLRFVMLTVVIGMLLAALILPVTAMAMGTSDVTTTEVNGTVQVLVDWLPALSILFLGLGQLLKTIPGFKPWLLPIIMAALGLAVGITLGILLGGSPLEGFRAAIEGIIVGLASCGLFELANKTIPADKDTET